MNSAAFQIEKTINDAPELTLWHISDFLDFSKVGNVKVILSRLAEEGKIRRLMDGIYYRPKAVLGIDVPPSMHDAAKKIAALHRWNIVPCGETALNALGLSTQVPFAYEYSSDGPYRKYCINGIGLFFRHKSTRFIKGMSYKTALFIQAIMALGKDGLDTTTMQKLSDTLSQGEIERILCEAKTAPQWVYSIAIELKGRRSKAVLNRG